MIVIPNPAGCVLRTFRCVGHGQPDPECSVLETKDSIETEMRQGEQLQELPGLGKIQRCCSSNVAEEQGAKESPESKREKIDIFKETVGSPFQRQHPETMF